MLDQANEFSLQGFKACNGQFPLLEKDSCGVEIKMALDDMNELVWEAKVPFRSFYKPVIDRRDRGKPLSICFETIGSKRPPGQNPGGQRSHGGGGFSPGFGMGGMGMSMRTGGASRGGQTNNDMEPLYKSTTTWKKIGIAVKD